MTTLPNELSSRVIKRAEGSSTLQVVLVADPSAAIEAAVVLGEQRAWLEALLGQSMDEAHPASREEYAHPETYYRPPDAALFVGRVGGFPAGVVAAVRLDPDTVELRRLYVRPVARGTGLGRRLSLAVIEHARRSGARRVRLDTVPELMPAAAGMYRALGFRDVRAADYTDVPGIVGMELAV